MPQIFRSAPVLVISILLPAVLGSSSAAAQSIRGTLVDEATSAPIEGGVITLLDEAGDRVARTLTADDGGFLLHAPGLGRYRLEAAALGYERLRTDALEPGVDEIVERTLRIRARPIGLEGVTARARPRCRPRPDATREGQRVWDEARTALAAVSATEDARTVTFRALRYDREIEIEGGRVTTQDVREFRSVNSHPFRSAPVDRLLEDGFVREAGDTTIYYAPDAHALLSDAFLSTHCFWAVEGADALVGLAFEPIPERRDRAEIEGVLWLSRATSELRTLEFTYTDVPTPPAPYTVGGDVMFRRLDDGAWVVERWELRLPVLARVVGSAGREIFAIREVGGEIVELTSRGADRALERRAGSVAGRLVTRDGVPITGALVYLSGTRYADTTDVAGRFRLDDVREGEYALHWHHEELNDGVPAPGPRQVRVEPGAQVAAEIEVVGAEAPLAGGCDAGERRSGTGVVFGVVRHGPTGIVLPGAEVVLAGADGEAAGEPRLRTSAGGEGRFRFCAVPPGEYVLRSRFDDFGVAVDTLRVEPDGRVRLEVELAAAAGAEASDGAARE
ncbi:MAG: carboxypeptidase regulatory-like domain-containing protein [Gemmatimonadota bacterium]